MLREEPARVEPGGHTLVLIKGDDGKIVGATCACGWHSKIKANSSITRNQRRKEQMRRRHKRYVWWMDNSPANLHN